MPKIALLLAALVLVPGAMRPAAAQPADRGQESSAPSRPHVIIYPRHSRLGPNAKRQCRAWLEQEYRVSGPVIVPRQQCWWE
jgi:hypothetical protein